MAPHSSTLAWKIPWMEEPGRLQSMGSLGVGHDWVTSLSLFTFTRWRRKWQPTPVFLPGESQGRGAWWAAVYGVAQSRTQLKRLSSSGIDYLIKFFFNFVYVFKQFLCFMINMQSWLLSQDRHMTHTNIDIYIHFLLFKVIIRFNHVFITISSYFITF